MGVDQATSAGHQLQRRLWHTGLNPRHVVADDRRQVGVDHGCIAAVDDPLQRRQSARYGNLLESQILGDLGDDLFLRAVAIGVQQTDRQRDDPLSTQLSEPSADLLGVDWYQHLTIAADSLVQLDCSAIECRRNPDTQIEQSGTILVGDPQDIGEPASGDQGRRCPLPLEQGVGSARGSQTYCHRSDGLIKSLAR